MIDISAEIKKILDGEIELAKESLKKTALKVGKKTVKELKARSPIKKGKYAKSWKLRDEGKRVVVFNDKHYRLTHLLERGHEIIAWGESHGRSKAKIHIEPIEKEKIKEFVEEVKKEIENG